jgi:hypothetical protein
MPNEQTIHGALNENGEIRVTMNSRAVITLMGTEEEPRRPRVLYQVNAGICFPHGMDNFLHVVSTGLIYLFLRVDFNCI